LLKEKQIIKLDFQATLYQKKKIKKKTKITLLFQVFYDYLNEEEFEFQT
jgi:hypothetical protein